MLNQRLQQKLLQKLSPQQILLMKLLQIPTVALEQRIKQEIEENPALEELADSLESNFNQEREGESSDSDEIKEESFEEAPNRDEDFDFADYLDEDDTPSYKFQVSNTGPDEERADIPFVSPYSFQDFLVSQLGLREINEKQYQIALTIIGNLDDSGYLQREVSAMVDDLAFSQNINASEEEILEVLQLIQEFDPAGVGARNLQECLCLQLKREEQKNEAVQLALLIMDQYFPEFTKKHYDRILKRARITESQLKNALGIILKLNPKPGNSMSETARMNPYVIPDFTIINSEGLLELSVNSRFTPELRLSRTYLDMMESYSQEKTKNNHHKEALQFIRQKIDSAKWFIEAIKQRQNTLYITMKAIMDFQQEYFISGDETRLKPMILKDIAEIVNLDISTVSRVANSKYVQTPYGTFLLKSFFSESLQTDSGEEVSTREIKKILSDCIDAENKDKPLTDEELTDILRKKGYNIARRTVAKYREQLNVPVARLRKIL